MIKRLKRFWKLSRKDPSVLDKLTEEDLAFISEAGDGKAVFFSEGTEKDLKEFEIEQKGLSGWYKRIRNL